MPLCETYCCLAIDFRTANVYIPQNNIYEKKEFSKLQIQFEFIKIFKIVVPFSVETSLYLAAFFFFFTLPVQILLA